MPALDSTWVVRLPSLLRAQRPAQGLTRCSSQGNLEEYLIQKRKGGGRSSKPWLPPPKQVSALQRAAQLSVPLEHVCLRAHAKCGGRWLLGHELQVLQLSV